MRGFCQQITLMGKVVDLLDDGANFRICCRSGDEFYVYITDQTYFRSLLNLDNLVRDQYGNPPRLDDRSPEADLKYKVLKYLNVGRLVVVEGVFFQESSRRRLDATTVHLLYDQDGRLVTEFEGNFLFEANHWWLVQISRLADTWLDSLFDPREQYDFALYQTNMGIIFAPNQEDIQEMATLSRLIYGLSSAYLLTGRQRYLDAARAGVIYQREHFRNLSHDGQYCFWAFGKRGTEMVTSSENPDDRDTIPLCEQIYALAGLTQYYRITLEWEVLKDIQRTMKTFLKFYKDKDSIYGGFFSHLDYASLRADVEALGDNRARKNWNSIGDHLPAYLINLILALEPLPKSANAPEIQQLLKECKAILGETTALIVNKFPEKDPATGAWKNPFVNERFERDWTPVKDWRWQQDRTIVGHNLKIAWNLTRVANYFRAGEGDPHPLMEVAETLANNMVEIGAIDLFRGGCYDALERVPKNKMPRQFVWLSTKDFWQQEQGILAYLILYGCTGKPIYRELAQELMAFWNIFFLDHENGGVFFRVTDNGSPVIELPYRQKGGHYRSGYHVFEIYYLTHIYQLSYVRQNPFCLFFKPDPSCSQTTINILPDFFPPGTLEVKRVTVNGLDRTNLNPDNFQLELNEKELGAEIVVEFKPIQQLAASRSYAERPKTKGKIGVLVESHFDETEVRAFNNFFPKQSYEVVYISRLWEMPWLEFTGNDHLDPLRVKIDFNMVDPDDFEGFILVGGYAMDRLRYEDNPQEGQGNQAPAVNFLRRIAQIKGLKIGTICHSLWLFTAAPGLLKGKKVTCAHNIIPDVSNAGAQVVYGPDGGAVDIWIDGDLITARHPGVVSEFMQVFLRELEKKIK